MRMRALICLALSWLLSFAGSGLGYAEKRVALVVGNGAYTYADRLANPVNDARGMRTALAGIGFDVVYGEDLDQNALRRTIGRFADIAQDADVAVVFFAGHGATFGDTPYVVPVDAQFSSLGQVPYELVPVETLIGELRRVKGVRIAILDACRDNAAEGRLKRQASRGGEPSRGLGPMRNPDGLILAYATQYLSTAADSGGGRNSPFTVALLNNIATPGLDVKDLFFKVGREVLAATGGKQRPEIAVSIYDQYALVPAASQIIAGTPAISLPPSSPAPARPPQIAIAAPPIAPAVPPATAAAAACDRAAASPFDRNRPANVAGVMLDQIEAKIAVPACEAAAQTAPNDPRIAFQLGRAYEAGKNGKLAARLYKLASDQGNALAQVNLGVLYENGRGGLPKNDREAARLYKLAADQGDAGGQSISGGSTRTAVAVWRRTTARRRVSTNSPLTMTALGMSLNYYYIRTLG